MSAVCPPDTRLAERVCVITGAASGIGRGIATVFAEHGAKLAMVDIGDLTETVEEIKKSMLERNLACREDHLLCVKCDITKEDQLRRAMQEIRDHYHGQRIHVVVNNAARFVFRDVLSASSEDWDTTLGVNIKGHALVKKHTVPHMVYDGTGSIINIASISSFIAQPNMVTYSVTKAAILQMTRNTALDLWSRFKIRCNAICPGAILTPATYAHYEGDKKKNPELKLSFEDWVKTMNRGIIDRLGSTREVGMACLFLASDESSYCTGSAMMVDGGWGTNPVL